MSATLKMPVRSGPRPTFRKSITLPRATRSTRFDSAAGEVQADADQRETRPSKANGHCHHADHDEAASVGEERAANGRRPVGAERQKGSGVLDVLESNRVGQKRLTWRPGERLLGKVLGDAVAANGRGDEHEQREPRPHGAHLNAPGRRARAARRRRRRRAAHRARRTRRRCARRETIPGRRAAARPSGRETAHRS